MAAGLSSDIKIPVNSPQFRDREDLFSTSVVKELNTYSTWSEMYLANDVTNINYTQEGDKYKELPADKFGKGIKSIFNKYTLVPTLSNQLRTRLNTPLVDTVDTRRRIKQISNPSIKNLVEQSRTGQLGRETYSYSDFMYCKHLGKVSNNYLITLRRFPVACNDYIGQVQEGSNIEEREIATSLGCMVTWLGTPGNEIENILSYSVKMPFKEVTAEMEDVKRDDNASTLSKMFSAFDSKYQQQVMKGYASDKESNPTSWIAGKLNIPLGSAPYTNQLISTDSHKIYGPVDVVKNTSMRDDKGLQFEHTFSLKFEYELRSYSNINTRQAMLDLLANILTVTYVNGSFWGGGYRGMGPHQMDIFSNLKIMRTGGGLTTMMDAFANDLSTIGSSVAASIQKQGGVINALKNLANSFGGMLLGGFLNYMGRPQKQAVNSLLSPAPVGLWHVTVGNPFHPIMSIGNLILEDTQITHTGPLGLDDFPTKLTVVCKLKAAKGRDANLIEQLYNGGVVRIYSGMDKYTLDIINSAPDYKGESKQPQSINVKKVDPENTTKIQKMNPDTTNEIDNISISKYMYYWNTEDQGAILQAGREWLRGGADKYKDSRTGQMVQNNIPNEV